MNETWWVNANDLDVDQKAILSSDPAENLLIVGPPGSGKTNILVLRANYVKATQPRIAFITFTRTLSEFLKSGPNIGRADQLQKDDLSTFMAWGKKTLRDAGVNIPVSTGKFNTDRRAVLTALQKHISDENPGKLYDVILVDEVQDFWAEEIEVLLRFSKNLNAAGDSRQAIWEHRQGLPAMEKIATKKVELINHYRIGQKICAFADRILPAKLGATALLDNCKYDELSRPSEIKPIACSSLNAEFAQCLAEVKKQLRYIVDEPILVVTHKRTTRDAFWAALQADGSLVDRSVLQTSEGYEEFGPDSLIRVMTIASAKGSEARALHLLEANNMSSGKRELAFTAVTRAKTEVALYHSKPLPGHMVPPSDKSPELDNCF